MKLYSIKSNITLKKSNLFHYIFFNIECKVSKYFSNNLDEYKCNELKSWITPWCVTSREWFSRFPFCSFMRLDSMFFLNRTVKEFQLFSLRGRINLWSSIYRLLDPVFERTPLIFYQAIHWWIQKFYNLHVCLLQYFSIAIMKQSLQNRKQKDIRSPS